MQYQVFVTVYVNYMKYYSLCSQYILKKTASYSNDNTFHHIDKSAITW
jgi:hypothetical protein